MLPGGLDRLRFQRHSDDGMLRFKIFQMRVQHPKEKIDIVGRLRNFKTALVIFFVRKSNPKSEFFCDEVDRAQSQSELLQKTAQHEKQRLDRFDFVFELEAFRKRFRRLDQLEQSSRLPIRAFPKTDCFRSKARVEIVFIQAGELTEGVNSPLMQDLQNLMNFVLPFSLDCLRVFTGSFSLR